jgi:hypothetical protein
MSALAARCARCDSEFELFALVEQGTGACPQCLRPLMAGDPAALLEWAAVAAAAQCRLSSAIHILQRFRGALIVEWGSVLHALAEEAAASPGHLMTYTEGTGGRKTWT